MISILDMTTDTTTAILMGFQTAMEIMVITTTAITIHTIHTTTGGMITIDHIVSEDGLVQVFM